MTTTCNSTRTDDAVVGDWIDAGLDLDTKAEMNIYTAVLATQPGRRGAFLHAVIADADAEDLSDETVKQLQIEHDREYERARQQVSRAEARAAAAVRQRLARPALRCCLPVPRSCGSARGARSRRSAARRSAPSDDDGGAGPEGRVTVLRCCPSEWSPPGNRQRCHEGRGRGAPAFRHPQRGGL